MNLPAPSDPFGYSGASVPAIGSSLSTPPPIGDGSISSSPSSFAVVPSPLPASSGWNEGLALFVVFVLLFILSVWDVTSKFALWVAIALVTLVWISAVQTGQAKTFWTALSE